MSQNWIDLIKLAGWLLAGFTTARVMYLKVYKHRETEIKSDDGDKLAAVVTFFIWPLVLALVLVGLTLTVLSKAITWEPKKKQKTQKGN
jgi:hypothetical protein